MFHRYSLDLEPQHSTETLHVEVPRDFHLVRSFGHFSILAVFDLSVALGLVVHSRLLEAVFTGSG